MVQNMQHIVLSVWRARDALNRPDLPFITPGPLEMDETDAHYLLTQIRYAKNVLGSCITDLEAKVKKSA